MEQIYDIKQKLMQIYSSKSKYVDMGMKFVVGLLLFSYINGNIGYMASLNKFIIVLGLSVVCSILPYGGMLAIAVMVMILHVFSASMVLSGCVAVVFLVLFIVYFRFTSELSVVVILTIVSLNLGMPAALPIACGLLIGPLAIIPMGIGSVIYTLVNVVSGIANTLSGELSLEGILEDGLAFVDQMKDNNEIIFYVLVIAITTTVVYIVRKIQMPHSWKIAIGSGYVISLIMSLLLIGILGVDISVISVIFGNLVAVLIGLVVEIIYLGVDYKETEIVEFEDDEYHYYVKMIPKIGQKKKSRGRRSRRVVQEDVEELEDSEEYYEGIEELDEYDGEYVEEYEDNEEELSEEEYEQDFSDEDRVAAYETDTELEEGMTTIIDSDEIERELRSNAYEKSLNSEEKQNMHLQANYEMLKNDMEKTTKSRRRRNK